MPSAIPYYRPRGQPSAGKLYERQPSRQEDKNFYSGVRWIRLAKAYLAEHPLCEKCRARLATLVHHKVPRKADESLAYEWSNLEANCQGCHNAQEVR